VTNTVFPLFKIERSISHPTATQWIMSLGYRPQGHQKSLYFDGHKQPEFLEARKKYIKDFDTYCKRSRIHGGNNLEIAAQVDPEVLQDMKEAVFVFHDESVRMSFLPLVVLLKNSCT
jgi:hypothetical protein